MPVKIRVRNFQSIADASVVVDGFTVVTGPNNSGKSSFQRAIRGAFQNARGSSFVRRGTTKAIVEVDFDDGRSVCWEKGSGKDAKPTYVIDGGSPLHPGQGVPEELSALGVRPVLAGGKTLWPQFAAQFTGQVFLLDEPGSVLAEAVADVERVGQLNQALKLAESDRRSAVAELKVRRADAERQERELERYAGIDDVAAILESLERDQKHAFKMETAISGLQKLKAAHSKAESTVAFLSGVETVDVPDDRDLSPLRALSGEMASLEGLQRRFKEAGVQVKRLSGIEVVDVSVDFSAAERVLAAIGVLEDFARRWEAVVKNERSAKEEVVHAARDAEDAEKQVAEFLENIGTCPYCGALTQGPAGRPCHENRP